MPRTFAWKSVLLAAAVAGSAACGAEGDTGTAAGTGAMAGAGGTGGDVGYATTVQPLFDRACNCHQSEPLMAPFSLKAAGAYEAMVNVPSMQLPTMNLVTPGKLNDSYLWHKIDGTQLEVGGMGGRMPLTIPLSADEQAIVEQWIVAGAPP
jgi:hypothetical protein